jgi:hypothetical protein
LNCREWEERIAGAARDNVPDAALYQHMARCAHCLRFAEQMSAVTTTLASWEVPGSGDPANGASRAALAERLAAIRQRVPHEITRRPGRRLGEQPAVIAVAGAAAMAAGALAAPGWIRLALVCWAALTALAVTVVLLDHSRPDRTEGEY